MNLYGSCLRPALFRFDPERVHHGTLSLCHRLGGSRLARRAVGAIYRHDDPRLATTVAGIDFPNPVGLAAGFDKDGLAAAFLPALGFGSIEIGSVSAVPSPGNTFRPRLFRLPADEGLLVAYGVPSDGAAVVAARLTAEKLTVPLGVSLVETNTGHLAPVDHVIEELAQAAAHFVAVADYLVLNLNCPNSAGGFSHFDAPENLRALIERISAIGQMPPVFLKLTPPAEPGATERILAAVEPFACVKGFILNTHAPRPYGYLNTPQDTLATMRGTLTGARLREPVREALRQWYRGIDRSRHVLIAVGGIGSAEDAYEAIRLGASLVHVYTALIYVGPTLVRDIKHGLARLLERDGFKSVADAVGTGN
jgi:dihydroorotate dehydrogenase